MQPVIYLPGIRVCQSLVIGSHLFPVTQSTGANIAAMVTFIEIHNERKFAQYDLEYHKVYRRSKSIRNDPDSRT